jgi:transketolase
LAVMRSFANMTVIVPADGIETANAVRASLDWPGPVYIRIGRGFEPRFYDREDYGFEIGKAIEEHPGTDVTLICCGVAVRPAVEAARVLGDQDGLSVRVINLHTLKPLDEQAVMRAVTETRRILTFEDHNTLGGLGSAVADTIAASGKGCAFVKVGVPDCFCEVGYPEDLQTHYGLDTDGIVAKVREAMHLDFEADEDWDDEV